MSRIDLDVMMKAIVPVAQDLLVKQGDFPPFGAVMTADGKVRIVPAEAEAGALSAKAQVDRLFERQKEWARDAGIVAVAVCALVHAAPTDRIAINDAIQLRLEHRDGEALNMFAPYFKTEPDHYSFGEGFGTWTQPQVFPTR